METETEPTPVIKHKDAIFTYTDGGLLKGYTKRSNIPEGVPWIEWHGNKIPHEIWQQILAFFAWTFDTYKDEAMVFLYYNEATGNWLAWAPPQKGMGMTVKEVSDHENWKQAEEFVGYVKVGTGHHHNSSPAFQSSVDSNDECTGNGIHFTIGNMDKVFHSIHARAVFNGNMVEVEMDDWVELSERYRHLDLPPELLNTAYDYSLQSRAPSSVTFPDQWKDNFIRTYYGGSSVGFSQGGNHHTSHTSNPNDNYGLSKVNGVEGYWVTVTNNGVVSKEFRPLRPQENQKKIIIPANSPSTETPAKRAEAKFDALIRSGLELDHLDMICESLKSTHRNEWTGDRDTLAVIQILNEHGLNVRWLEKYLEDERFFAQHTAEGGKTQDVSQWEQVQRELAGQKYMGEGFGG